jgi:DNA-binding phage protein
MAKKPKELKPYKSYPFRGQDPIVSKVELEFAHADAKKAAVSRDSGVSSGTIGNWFSRKTKRPQFATVNAVLMALGRELTITKKK